MLAWLQNCASITVINGRTFPCPHKEPMILVAVTFPPPVIPGTVTYSVYICLFQIL